MSTHRLPEGVVVRRARPDDAEALAHLHVDVLGRRLHRV